MRGSRALGLAMVVGFAAMVSACVALPIQTPEDPDIPGASTPAFPNLTNPPTTAGPTTPPVPTTPPGTFAMGQTVTIHTSMGSTWEITPTQNIDPADSIVDANGYSPPSGSRFVILELSVTNVGVVTTHPYYDMTFGYQPDNAPIYDQNSAATAAAPNDLGYLSEIYPGDTVEAQVIVAVPEGAPTGAWLLSGDNEQTVYRFE